MAYVPGRGLLCQVNVGGDNGIYCMDPATGNVVSSITGAFQWTATSQRGLAYRSDDDSFYIGGWNEGIVYHIAGLSSSQPGQVLGTCMPGDGAISGLAYNSAAGVLWAATNSPTDTIYELNPSDCTVLSTLAHPQPGFQGGGLEMDEAGNLWMIGQSPNRVFLVDSGVPAFSDVPWLSVSPTSGTVAAGKQKTLTVTIDTHGLTPGLYLATRLRGHDRRAPDADARPRQPASFPTTSRRSIRATAARTSTRSVTPGRRTRSGRAAAGATCRRARATAPPRRSPAPPTSRCSRPSGLILTGTASTTSPTGPTRSSCASPS